MFITFSESGYIIILNNDINSNEYYLYLASNFTHTQKKIG
jgi:hypothetical protein